MLCFFLMSFAFVVLLYSTNFQRVLICQVDRHGSFQESRCFFVVSTDGHKEDFSYRKCLQNLIKGKYPELAEAFIDKYFSKPRPGGNRERNPILPETTGNEEIQ